MDEELMGTVHQVVVEIVARSTHVYLKLCQLCQRLRIYLRKACAEYHTLSFLDVELEIAWNEQILVTGIATLLLLRIFQTTIPVWLINETILFINLHEQLGITRIHASFYAVLHLLI